MDGHDKHRDSARRVRREFALSQLAREVYYAQLRTTVPVKENQPRCARKDNTTTHIWVSSVIVFTSAFDSNLVDAGAIRCSSELCMTMRTVPGGAYAAVRCIRGRSRMAKT